MPKLTIKEIKPNIFHVTAKNDYDISSTFMRLSEFSECPSNQFRNKVFTVEKYMDWYAEEFDNFTYTSDWTGFNISGDTVRRFFAEFNSILLKKERMLESLLRNYMGNSRYYNQGKKFYLIGTCDKDDVVHELAHAFYYLDKDYRKVQNNLHHKHNLMFVRLRKALIDAGYAKTEKMLLDEIQAYLGEPDGIRDSWLKKFKIPWKMHLVKEYRKNLNRKLKD